MTQWQETFDKYLADAQERSPYSPSDYYRSGRASKAHPQKEGPEWWAENGPKFVESWTTWREQSGLRVMNFPGEEGEALPGIELEVWAERGDLKVRSIIDRVLVDADDELLIVDIKTGSSTPPWPLQLALNNLCLRDTFGASAKWGGFWKARSGGVDKWHDLSRFTDDLLWEWVAKAKAIRDQQLFIPNAGNLCASACGVKDFCVAAGGVDFFSAQGATLLQTIEQKVM